MTITTTLGMTLVEPSQAQKEVTINQALICLDALLSGAVLDKDLAAPPTSPTAGMVYIIAASPTGAWVGHAKAITYFDQVWHFITPQTSMRVWVKDESQYYEYSGTAWVTSGTGIGAAGSSAKLTVYGANSEGIDGQTIRLGQSSSIDYSFRRNTTTGTLEFEGSQTSSRGFKFMSGTVAIGPSDANASAQLDVQSTTQGVLFPRMTTSQKNAITSPAEGLMVYDTTLHKLCVRTASAWETITSV